jgi:hypothetical protein
MTKQKKQSSEAAVLCGEDDTVSRFSRNGVTNVRIAGVGVRHRPATVGRRSLRDVEALCMKLHLHDEPLRCHMQSV